MKKYRNYIYFAALLLSVVLLPFQNCVSASSERLPKLLYIYQTGNDPQNIQMNELDSFDPNKVALKSVQDYSKNELGNYAAVALPFEQAAIQAKALIKAFNSGTRIYLYGEFTIANLKNVLGIDKFGADVQIYEADGKATDQTAFQYLGEDQEQNDVINVVGLSRGGNFTLDQIYLAYIEASDQNIIEQYQYFRSIFDDVKPFLQENNNSVMSIVTVKSQFNIVSYYFNSNSSTHLDYTLYRNYDEQDPTYDYFAIKSNVWAYSTDEISGVDVKHDLPYASDNMLDHGPGSQTYASSVGVSVDMSGGVSLNFSYNLDGGPTINCSPDYTNDIISWTLRERIIFPEELDNEVFKTSSSWASSGTYAGTNIIYRSITNYGPSHQYPVFESWRTVQVRYDY